MTEETKKKIIDLIIPHFTELAGPNWDIYTCTSCQEIRKHLKEIQALLDSES